MKSLHGPWSRLMLYRIVGRDANFHIREVLVDAKDEPGAREKSTSLGIVSIDRITHLPPTDTPFRGPRIFGNALLTFGQVVSVLGCGAALVYGIIGFASLRPEGLVLAFGSLTAFLY